jgi:hypothetical protein
MVTSTRVLGFFTAVEGVEVALTVGVALSAVGAVVDVATGAVVGTLVEVEELGAVVEVGPAAPAVAGEQDAKSMAPTANAVIKKVGFLIFLNMLISSSDRLMIL